MEEDIKILEDLAETLNKTCENGICEASMSIENLIKGYRDSEDIMKNAVKENLELKEYIRELEEDNQKFESGKFLTPAQCVRIGKDYIPKSKVKEVMEELNEEYERKITEDNINHFVYSEQYAIAEEYLKKLMEDK